MKCVLVTPESVVAVISTVGTLVNFVGVFATDVLKKFGKLLDVVDVDPPSDVSVCGVIRYDVVEIAVKLKRLRSLLNQNAANRPIVIQMHTVTIVPMTNLLFL